MKRLITFTVLSGVMFSALAQVGIMRNELGSGTPGAKGLENAVQWGNDIYHAPQYMPGYPTAAILYPRVVDVECSREVTGLACKGYNWLPELGRGEYLMFRPVVKVEPDPKVITQLIIKEVPGPVREVLVEVPAKKKGE